MNFVKFLEYIRGENHEEKKYFRGKNTKIDNQKCLLFNYMSIYLIITEVCIK